MTQLVENPLTLARSDANLAEMPLAPLDVREVLQSVCAEMGRVAEAGQIRVQASLGDEPAMISGNRQALHRLFLALLDNAIKYSRAGGEVLLSAETSESGVAVTVEDFGAGISEADLPHIFKRFYRADQARSGGGHGLGLPWPTALRGRTALRSKFAAPRARGRSSGSASTLARNRTSLSTWECLVKRWESC